MFTTCTARLAAPTAHTQNIQTQRALARSEGAGNKPNLCIGGSRRGGRCSISAGSRSTGRTGCSRCCRSDRRTHASARPSASARRSARNVCDTGRWDGSGGDISASASTTAFQVIVVLARVEERTQLFQCDVVCFSRLLHDHDHPPHRSKRTRYMTTPAQTKADTQYDNDHQKVLQRTTMEPQSQVVPGTCSCWPLAFTVTPPFVTSISTRAMLCTYTPHMSARKPRTARVQRWNHNKKKKQKIKS